MISENDKKFLTIALTKDRDLLLQLKDLKNKGDYYNALKIYSLRRASFHQFSELTKKVPISIAAQAYLNTHIAEMELELKNYSLENSINEQIANLVSKVETIESDIKKIKNHLKIE